MTLPRDARNEVASLARDPNIVVYGGGILRPNDATLLSRGGGRGLLIYDELERDALVYALMQTRKMAVVAREWRVDAASDDALDQRARDVVKRQLAAINFDQLCYDLLDGILKGFSVAEIMWEIRGREVAVAGTMPRDQRRFAFTVEDELRLLTLVNMIEGEPVPARKFIVHRFGAKDGSPYGLGLGTRLFWPVLFKREGISFWLRFTERFGMPTVVGKYPNGATADEKRVLLNAAIALTSEGAVTIPEGMLLELLEAQKSGSIANYDGLLAYMDTQMTVTILGQTLTTSAGKVGSQALGTVHNQVREELTDADADLLCGTLNASLVKWIAHFNVPGARPPLVWREKPADENAIEDLRAKRASRLKTIRSLGLEPEDPDAYENAFGEKYRPIAKPVTAEPVEDEAAFAAPGGEDDPVAGQVDALGGVADREISAMVAKVRALLDEVDSLDELGRRLIELYPGIAVETLGDLLAEGMIATELAGRFEVADGR